MRRLSPSLALLLAVTTSAMAAPPADKGKPGKGKHADYATQEATPANGGKRDGAVTRGNWDESGFRSYVGQQSFGRYDSLPPGIRKNLARGKPLPPGLQTRAIPREMLYRLPVREGYEWRAAGRDLVLYSVTTQVIDQVLSDVFD